MLTATPNKGMHRSRRSALLNGFTLAECSGVNGGPVMPVVGPPTLSCPVMITLRQITTDFASALKAVDAAAPQGSSRTRTYRPGVGPLNEAEAIRRAFAFLAGQNQAYADAMPCLYPNSRQT